MRKECAQLFGFNVLEGFAPRSSEIEPRLVLVSAKYASLPHTCKDFINSGERVVVKPPEYTEETKSIFSQAQSGPWEVGRPDR